MPLALRLSEGLGRTRASFLSGPDDQAVLHTAAAELGLHPLYELHDQLNEDQENPLFCVRGGPLVTDLLRSSELIVSLREDVVLLARKHWRV